MLPQGLGCFYSTQRMTLGMAGPFRVSAERLNNGLPHCTSNVVWICRMLNCTPTGQFMSGADQQPGMGRAKFAWMTLQQRRVPPPPPEPGRCSRPIAQDFRSGD